MGGGRNPIRKETYMGIKVEGPRLLTVAEVAALFRVDRKTVIRWADDGKLTSFRTLGGHRRFRAAEVEALLNGETKEE